MFMAEWDWIAAERSFQRALAINPNHAEAYLYYGFLMEALGDLKRGLHLRLQGLECDSTSALAHLLIAVSFWNQRRYDDLIVWANKTPRQDEIAVGLVAIRSVCTVFRLSRKLANVVGLIISVQNGLDSTAEVCRMTCC